MPSFLFWWAEIIFNDSTLTHPGLHWIQVFFKPPPHKEMCFVKNTGHFNCSGGKKSATNLQKRVVKT